MRREDDSVDEAERAASHGDGMGTSVADGGDPREPEESPRQAFIGMGLYDEIVTERDDDGSVSAVEYVGAARSAMTAPDIVRVIRQRYSDDGRYAVLEEVASCTGAIRGRRGAELLKDAGLNAGSKYGVKEIADILVLPLWPSDGLGIIGFEIKVSRSDFLSEIRDAGKNGFWKRTCKEFWYVTAAGVVRDSSEIPDGCGWMEATPTALILKLAAEEKPSAAVFEQGLVAALVRAAVNDGPVEALSDMPGFESVQEVGPDDRRH